MARQRPIDVRVRLLRGVQGSHRTLLELLASEFEGDALSVDGQPHHAGGLDPAVPHDIEVRIARLTRATSAGPIRDAVQTAGALGSQAITVRSDGTEVTLARANARPPAKAPRESLPPRR